MNMSHDFEGKVVFIAGTTNTNIRIAQAFSQHGAKVILAGKKPAEMFNETFIEVDLTSAHEIESVINKVVLDHGKLDISCNDAVEVADTYHLTMLAEIEERDWDRLMKLHLKSIWLCMKYELLQMRMHGSAIVNCSSVIGRSGYAGLSALSAAQHGVIGLTQSAARQYAPAGIRINAVCPTLSGRVEPTVDAILWLCSRRSSFVSGQAIKITGGV